MLAESRASPFWSATCSIEEGANGRQNGLSGDTKNVLQQTLHTKPCSGSGSATSAELRSHRMDWGALTFPEMPYERSIRTLLSEQSSPNGETDFANPKTVSFSMPILLAQGRPQTRDRRIHSDVHHPLLAEIVGATRPDDRTPGGPGPRPIRTVNEESGSGSSFRAR